MLEKEFIFFIENQKDLYFKYPEKHLVIKDTKVESFFDTHMDAYNYGKNKFGLGSFLIQHCLPGKEAVTRVFNSQVVI